MGLNLHAYHYDRRRPPRIGRRLLAAALLILGAVKILAGSHQIVFGQTAPVITRPPPPSIIIPAETAAPAQPAVQFHQFSGARLKGTGAALDLGDRRTGWPLSLLSNIFPDEMILPSCLTEPAPAMPQPGLRAAHLPVGDDWPGFYGAPWTGWVNGNLIALLDVYGPRLSGPAVPAPVFQIYPHYTGQQAAPSFTSRAPARLYRGSKATLYRVFLNRPETCLDLVVQNGANTGTGHLYYQKNHHIYQSSAIFKIQP